MPYRGDFSPGQALEMLPKPDTIFATTPRPNSVRPVRTVGLLARMLGSELHDEHGSDDIDALILAMRSCDRVVLACWRHQSIAAIARAFVGDASPVPEWDERRFDLVWQLAPACGG